MGHDRHNAAALNAADAKTLLNSTLPFVLKSMTPDQIDQVQAVLDAEVVNPEIQKKANEIYQNSVRAQSGSIVMRDENQVNRAYKLQSTQIQVTEKDKHIRLNFKVLLTPDSLLPVTDNPDEASYLLSVKKTLENKGVWLRFEHQLVRDPADYGHWMIDPRSFKAWLSLGYDGDQIPTKNGQIDRQALLGTALLGSGYYDAVHHGPIQQALERQMSILSSDIDDGIAEHTRLIARKSEAPIVGGISDTLGGADLPDISIWDTPVKLLVTARKMNVNGNVYMSQPFLLVAAIMVRNDSSLLAEYADKSAGGAASAVKILKVAKTAGKVAELVLAVTGVAGLARAGAGMVAGETAVTQAEVDEAAEECLKEYLKKNPELGREIPTTKIEWVPGPKGSIGGGIKPGHSSGIGQGIDVAP